jgi:hypothetical protein
MKDPDRMQRVGQAPEVGARDEDKMTNRIGTSSKPGEFRTADLYFAAYLQTAGTEMKRTDRENGRVYFVFDSTVVNIEELKQAWINNTGKVPAQPYAHNIKSLKSVCHMA